MELSTPVIQVWDKVLTLPVIGTLDSMRAARLTEGLLARISETQSEVVIFDISGVPTIDTLVAQHLLRTVQAAALMGTVSIMCGVRPETAQAMVHLGIEIDQLLSRGTLQDALQLALTLISERAGATRQASETLGRTGLL
jgi:anti-anti-sigma regulatory factor